MIKASQYETGLNKYRELSIYYSWLIDIRSVTYSVNMVRIKPVIVNLAN
jgi:hypothetical protein